MRILGREFFAAAFELSLSTAVTWIYCLMVLYAVVKSFVLLRRWPGLWSGESGEILRETNDHPMA